MSRPTPGDERVQAYLDGRMPDEQRRLFERELAGDDELRAQLETLQLLDGLARDTLGGEAPADLAQSLGATLDREIGGRRRALPRWLAAAAALLLVVLGAWMVVRVTSGPAPTPPDLRLEVAHDVHEYVEGRLALDHSTADVVAMERYFAEQGIDFETRVFDLAMMQLNLAGGLKHELAGHDSAAFVYHGPEDLRVLCQMYRGSEDELPPGADVRVHNGITFYSYEIDCVSMSFWREGDVICVLAAMGDLERVVALAFAKAVRV